MHLISYDLKKTKNYPKLYQCLNQWRGHRLLESLWIVANLRGPCGEIRKILAAHIDSDDALVVIQLPRGIDWAAMRSQPGGTAFLHTLGPVRAA